MLIRSAAVFKGYYKQAEATRETITARAGCGPVISALSIRRGHLVIVDRAKDVGKLADGTPFAPQFVENKLKFSPFIARGGGVWRRAALCRRDDRDRSGHRREAGPNAAISLHLFQDLSAKPEVRRLIADEIAEVNASLPAAARIRRFLLLNKEFDADDNEITRTRKVRRRFVAEKYAALIEAFYSGQQEVELATEITYEDGRKAILTSKIVIEDVIEAAEPEREPAYAA